MAKHLGRADARGDARLSLRDAVIGAAAAACALFAPTPTAEGAPIFNLRIEAIDVTQGQSSYSTSVGGVAAGDTINYQVVGNMSPLGTVYTGIAGFTITSLTAGPDGANGLRFDIFETTDQQVQSNFAATGSLQNGWDAQIDNSPGQLIARGNGNNDVSAVRPIRVPNNFSAVAPEVIYTGSFTIASVGSGTSSLLNLRWSSGSGSLHVNGSGISRFPNLATETGTNAFVSYTPLTLSVGPPPPPVDTSWKFNASGTWGNNANWTNGTPGNYYLGPFWARLGSVITSPQTVTMNGSHITSGVIFESSVSYTVDGSGTLDLRDTVHPHFNVAIATPVIWVTSGNHAINAPVSFAASAMDNQINVNAGASLTCTGLVTFGEPTLFKSGPGTLILSNINAQNRAISVDGTLRAGAPDAFSNVTTLSISSSANLDLNGNNIGVTTISAAGAVHLGAGTLSVTSGTVSGSIDGAGGGITLGSGTLTLTGSNSYTGVTTVNGGTLSVNSGNALGLVSQITMNAGTLSFTGTTNSTRNLVSSGGSAAIVDTGSFAGSLGAISGTSGLTKNGTGTLTINSLRIGGSATVSAGRVQIASSQGAAGTSVLPALPALAAGTRFDLNDSRLIIQFGTGASPLAATRTAILNGRGGTGFGNATWNGANGIASAAAAPGGIGDGVNPGDGISFALGYVENSFLPLLGLPSYTSFGGQSADSGSMLIRFTKGADCNLDGKVNSDDLTVVYANYNLAGTGDWFNGDFDYDGICDTDDVGLLGAMYSGTDPALSVSQLTAQYGAAFAGAVDRGRTSGVPEPTGVATLTAGAMGMLGARRRRRGERS